MSKGKIKLIVFLLVVVALVVVARSLPFEQWFAPVQDWIKALGFWGLSAYSAIYAIATVLFVPGSMLTLASAGLFGLWKGFVAVVVGSNLGANAAFLIGRYFARGFIEKKVSEKESFTAIDQAIEKQGGKIVFLVRLSPFFPFSLLNYGLGLTSVRWSAYAIATFIGMLPGTFLWVYIGYTAAESVTKSAGQVAMLIIGLLATLVVSIIITKIARKALKEATDS